MESSSGRTFSGDLEGSMTRFDGQRNIGKYTQFFAKDGMHYEIGGIRFDGSGRCRGAYNV
jgi:hypothetical protein